MMPPPGTRLLRLARAWFDEATVTRVFEPRVADWQHEAAMTPRGRHHVCLARGYASFMTSFALVLPRLFLRPRPVRLTTNVWGAVALRGMRELTVPELLSAQPPLERGLWRPTDWNDMRKTALVERASNLAMPRSTDHKIDRHI